MLLGWRWMGLVTPCCSPSLLCLFPSLLCFPLKLCLTQPPAFHTPFYVSLSCLVHHPLMLLLWSLFMICLSLLENLLVCWIEKRTDPDSCWRQHQSCGWHSLGIQILTSWHIHTHTQIHTAAAAAAAFPVQSLFYCLVCCPRYLRGARTGTKRIWAAVPWCD